MNNLSAADNLIKLYEEILREPTFEMYEEKSLEIEQFFNKLQQETSSDRGKLLKVKELHDQLISVILLEKESLGKQITDFGKRKYVSNQYGKVSNHDNVDAFFVDYKN